MQVPSLHLPSGRGARRFSDGLLSLLAASLSLFLGRGARCFSDGLLSLLAASLSLFLGRGARRFCGGPSLLLLSLLLFLPLLPAAAQEPLVTRATLIGVGRATQQDTYLSPLRYTGTQFHLLTEATRPRKTAALTTASLFQLDLSTTQSPADNADFLGGALHYDYAWLFSLFTPPEPTGSPFTLALGPQVGATLGALYNTRNGNNPAQAIADLHLSLAAAATYRFRLFNSTFLLQERLDAPVLGAQFSPNYGQSYYEIFSLGNTDHNVCLTHPFNAPTLRSRLTLDFRLWRQTFRVGYLMDLRQSQLNDLKRHTCSHAFIIGWVRHLTCHHPQE